MKTMVTSHQRGP